MEAFLELADSCRAELQHEFLGTEHLLIAAHRVSFKPIEKMGLTEGMIVQEIRDLLGG